LFTGVDEGVNVAECIEHPYFSFTSFWNGGHCNSEGIGIGEKGDGVVQRGNNFKFPGDFLNFFELSHRRSPNIIYHMRLRSNIW